MNIDGVPIFRLDLACAKAHVEVEYDGEQFHTSGDDRAADAARRDWLRRHGWYVIVLTKESFTDEALRAWTSELRGVLRQRGVSLG